MGNESSTLSLLHDLAVLEAAIRKGNTSKSVQAQHSWNEDDISSNITIMDDNITIKRGSKHGHIDAARGNVAYNKGVHFFQFIWKPGKDRHVAIGVSTKECPLVGENGDIVLGANDNSIGFNLVSREIFFNGYSVKEFPEYKADSFKMPAIITMILNMDNGTLSFKSEKEDYGWAMKGLNHIADELYVSAALGEAGDEVVMKYLGGSDTVAQTDFEDINELRFHEVCGKNVTLQDGRRRALRKNPKEQFVNATVLTERPLQDGEMFELKLEALDKSKWKGSWMFGVTTTSPVELNFPDDMSVCTQGKVWIYNENKIGYQGKAVEHINSNLDDLEPGDTVGVQKQGSQLQFYVDGNRQASLLIDDSEPVYGVVDVYGQATCVSLQGNSNKQRLVNTNVTQPKTADEYLDGLKITLEMLKRKDPKELTLAKQMVGINMETAYHRIKGEALQRLAAKKVVDMDGAQILTDYLDFLKQRGLKDAEDEQFFYSLRSVCWNYCDNSILLCQGFGESGLLDTLIDDIKGNSRSYRESTQQAMVVYTAFGILHNCAKATENKPIYQRHNFVEEAKEYTDASKNHSEIVMNALFTMSYVFEDDEVEFLASAEPTAQHVVNTLNLAVESEDNHQHDGWHAYELAQAISNLSANSRNVKLFVQKGAIGPLSEMLDFDDSHEIECALNAIWSLTTDENKIQISATPGLSSKLKELSKSVHERVEQASVRLMMKLQSSQSLIGVASKKLHTCTNKELCERLKSTLGLAKEYFDESFDMCFCAICHGKRGDKTKYTRGNPPKAYGIPVGWYRFGLKPPPKAKALKAFENWHRAFHGTKKDHAKTILEVGEIVPPGRKLLGGKKIAEDEKMVLSQTIRYAGIDAYATPFSYKDVGNGTEKSVKLAFQVLIHPESYTAGPETTGATTEIDPDFSNQELEWSTIQHGSTIIYGFLVKMEE